MMSTARSFRSARREVGGPRPEQFIAKPCANAKPVVLTTGQPMIEVARLLHGFANQVTQPEDYIPKKRR